jgi:hypothetical protein
VLFRREQSSSISFDGSRSGTIVSSDVFSFDNIVADVEGAASKLPRGADTEILTESKANPLREG